VASVDLVGPRGETATASDLGTLQHLVNVRGYKPSLGTYADAVALLSGYAGRSTASSGSARVLRPVATRPNALGQGTQAPPAGLSVTYKAQHTITADCTDLRLLFANWQFSASGAVEADGANQVSVRASIEPTSGATRRPFDFLTGSRVAAIDPGAAAMTEPLGWAFPQGRHDLDVD
jgi:hypothetical protein